MAEPLQPIYVHGVLYTATLSPGTALQPRASRGLAAAARRTNTRTATQAPPPP